MLRIRKWITTGSIAVLGLATVSALVWLASGQPHRPQVLRMERATTNDDRPGIATPRTKVIPDYLRQKYASTRRAEFDVASSLDTSIFVLATGVQVHTPSGWQMLSEDYRGEIWRLKSGVAREVCVEQPEGQTWRAYIRFGTEMKATSLLKAQIKEAWNIRSFSNWTGRAWGGGRWSGRHELFSDEVTE